MGAPLPTLFALLHVVGRTPPRRSPREGPLAVRAALVSLWIQSTLLLADGAPPDAPASLGTALAACAVALEPDPRRQALLLGAVLLATTFDRGLLHGLGALGAAALAPLLVERAFSDRSAVLRRVAWSTSLFGLLCVLLPAALWHHEPRPLLEPRPALALGLAAAGFALGGWSAAVLMAGGGTPDPFDPPHALTTAGPYRWLRHPLQLAEGLLAWAPFALRPGPLVAAGATGFCLLLLGPVRWFEAEQLRRRFGVRT